jgi:signal transduction histidine kinase
MSLARSLLLVLGVATPMAVLVGALYGTTDGLLTLALLAGVCGGFLTLAHAIVRRRRSRMGSLRRQFALAVAVAVGQMVVAAGAGAALMFVSGHDALIIALISVLAGIVAVRTAVLFAGGVMDDIDRLRATLVAVGEGARDPAAPTRSADELAQLAGAANATIAKLAAAEAARRNLIAAVSHDLRTPITSLQLLVEAVEDGIGDPDTQRDDVRQMGTHVRALSSLIDDLFELSRLEAGEIAWTVQRVRLDELVGETVDAMRPAAQARRVEVRAELPAGLAPAQASPEKLQRVLFNLIQNAIRHTPADGAVTVAAQDVDGCVEIEVADTGEGIGEDDRRRVFEPFFRGGAEAARTRTGAGLGLAISRAIVEAHGGRIWLADSERGTRVRFSVPAAATDPADDLQEAVT